MIVEQNEIMNRLGMTLMRLLAVMESATGLESGIQLDEEKTHFRAIVRQVQKTTRLFVP